MLQRGHSGDGCDLASTLCKYDLRKGDLLVLSWARVRRLRRGSISSELQMCGGDVRRFGHHHHHYVPYHIDVGCYLDNCNQTSLS